MLFYFNIKKSANWLRLTGLSEQILMVKELLVTERVGGNGSTILRVSGDFVIEDRHSGGEEKVVEDAELEANDY
nr:Mariner Mos1 transposase [Hymenolepis microstoma]CUU97507.1 Mariner Mos1 transposase [Hymenolepis microstoma]